MRRFAGAPAQAWPLAWGSQRARGDRRRPDRPRRPDLSRATLLGAHAETPGKLGGPYSPDGKTLVVPTPAGLLERGPGKPRLLRLPKGDAGAGEDHDCTVSNDGTHAACVRAGRVWVGAWDAP